MNIRAIIAIILCKSLRFVSRLLHRGGTAMPGRFALKVCPGLLSILAKDVKTVAITGTNGKTTSARMIEEAFAISGKSCFANRSGANMIDGITTEFVMNCSIFGKMRKEYAVIECDEAAAKRVFKHMRPKVIVVTNLFRDQLDRYGDVTHTLEHIRLAAEASPDSILCVNGDCSLCASLAESVSNPVRFFGIDKGALPSKEKSEISDATHCIRCKNEYEYDYITFGHLGGFSCPHCGYKRSAAHYAVTNVVEQSLEGSRIVMNVNGKEALMDINLPAVYNIYNAAATAAACTEMGLSLDTVISALAGFKCGFGRMESFELGGGAKMMLVKNPAGCNLVTEFLRGVKERFILVICLNDRPGDGTDISWIWDAELEGLCTLPGLEKLIISGDRAADMWVRVKYAGVKDEFIEVEQDYEKIVSALEKQDKKIFIMPNYTSMLEMREVIVKHCGGADFWE